MSDSIVVDVATETNEPITDQTEISTQETESVEVQNEATQQPELENSERYAGKTMDDVIKMQQEAEKLMSKQSGELGDAKAELREQRQLVKALLEAQRSATEATPNIEETVDFEQDFYSDPADAVNKAIENHPELIEARKERQIQQQQHQVGILEKAYPDWQDRVADKTFQEWVASSDIRKEMFDKADSDYRPDYAIELFDMFDKVNMIDKTKEVQKAETQKRDKALKATTTETRSTSDSIGGKKVYRRADLINLQVTDPSRYASLADEIQSAYAEGRVK
jgi:hypothetical protein